RSVAAGVHLHAADRLQLAAVARTGRAADDPGVALEDDAVVGGVGVETRLRRDRVGIDVGVHAGYPVRDSRDQLRIGLARLIGIDLLSGMVNARLEAVPRVVERVLRVPARLWVELADGGRRRALATEVGEGLAGRANGDIGNESLHPRSGRDHDDLGVEVVD